MESAKKKFESMKSLASGEVPFTGPELDNVIASLQSLAGDNHERIDWAKLRALFERVAHVSHKNWAKTEADARELFEIIKGPDDSVFTSIFTRVLEGGHWKEAEVYATSSSSKPWVVLVTGVNGIRKSSSLYQKWFNEVLQEALSTSLTDTKTEKECLPDGGNAFFRQLDYMIATVAHREFTTLFQCIDDIAVYAASKDAIFMRYRKIAEMLGVLLLQEAKRKGMNVMLETSGRDVAMFKYVDHFFPGNTYNKMVVHFTINDISYAEISVDKRMAKEMADGKKAAGKGNVKKVEDIRAVISANAGGPYGSVVLKGVQADSTKVWKSIVDGTAGNENGDAVGKSWYKACISIHGSDADWTVSASKKSNSKKYDFGEPIFLETAPTLLSKGKKSKQRRDGHDGIHNNGHDDHVTAITTKDPTSNTVYNLRSKKQRTAL